MTGLEHDKLVQDGAKTVASAVTFTGIGRTELYRLMGEGKLPYLMHGRRRLIPVNALRQLLAERLPKK